MSVHLPILKNLLLNPRRTFVVDDKKSYSGAELLIAANPDPDSTLPYLLRLWQAAGA